MQTKTLMEKYGQFGFQSDIDGFVKLFDNTYIREIFLKVYNGDDVLVHYTKKNLIAECATGSNQKKRLVLKEIVAIDNQSVLMDITVDNISECISHQRGTITDYYFIYKGMIYNLGVVSYSKKFEPRTFTNKVGQAVDSISTQDLLKNCGSSDCREMTPQEFYDVFTLEGTHLSMVEIWITDNYLNDNCRLRQDSTLLKNRIKNVCLRHEINEDGSENIILHRGKVKGKGGYDSDFVIVVPCDRISGCICREQSYYICREDKRPTFKNDIKMIQFAFNNVICLLEYKQEVE